RSARRGASGAAEANAPDAGGDDGIGLSELRTAISRIDGEIECEIARSAPVGASSVEIAAAIRESAPVPGLDHADVARIAVALAAIPAASRPAPTAAAPAAGPSLAPATTPDSGPR
ncbi:MAG: hypothetical protein ACKOCT_09525, partial [Alphaproteobacteria bacterium]